MIKMLTAYTEEVDEVEEGIAELLRQIDLGSLKKNNLGLVTCHSDFINIGLVNSHSEFINTGFVKELCKKLPFDIIGMTTMASANKHGQSMYSMSLTVLTSDDVSFATAMTGPLTPEDYQEKLDAAYTEAAKKLPDRPAMIVAFYPHLKTLGGAFIHRALDEVCSGVPIWGGIATDSNISPEHCFIFRNGDVSKRCQVMALFSGPIDPEFVVISIPSYNIRKARGRVTDSDGCLLKEINGIPALKYLENMGVAIMEDASVITPLMVFYEGSSEPVALAIYTVNEDGSLLCGAEITKGATVTVGEITNDSIMATTEEGLRRMIESGRRNGALFLPCVTRYVMLVPNRNAEMDTIANQLEDGNVMPFMVGYAGGELCPVRDENGVLRNRFHNFTFSAYIL